MTINPSAPITPQAPVQEPVQWDKVGGRLFTVSKEFTRPANTTAYAVGDVVSNDATTTTLIQLSNSENSTKEPGAVYVPGGSGFLVKATLETDQKGCTASMNLTLYTVPAGDGTGNTVIVPADNAPSTVIYANAAYDLGSITFPALAEGTNTTDSTGAKAYWVGQPVGVVAFTGSVAIYGLLTTNTAFTPASGQKFYVRLTILQN